MRASPIPLALSPSGYASLRRVTLCDRLHAVPRYALSRLLDEFEKLSDALLYTSLDKNCICEAHLQCVIRFSGQYFSSENHFLKPIGGEMRDSFSFDRLDTSYAAQTSGLWLFQQTFLVLGAVVL